MKKVIIIVFFVVFAVLIAKIYLKYGNGPIPATDLNSAKIVFFGTIFCCVILLILLFRWIIKGPGNNNESL